MADDFAHEPTRPAPAADTGPSHVAEGDTGDPADAIERDMAQVLAAVETALFGGLSEEFTIGRFRVERQLGRGGMGVVYAAYDPHLDRTIAIKLIRSDPSGEGEQAKARLLREAQAMARLNHPNVIHVYDIGELDGDVYVAMELVVGKSLTDWLRAELRPLEQTLQVLSDAGRGLAAAHAAGIVHRDFKPDNVLVGDDGRVRVLDFGLAAPVSTSEFDGGHEDDEGLDDSLLGEGVVQAVVRNPTRPATGAHPSLGLADGSSASAPRPRTPSGSFEALALTRTGALMGTPTFMAPEQFRGERSDARTDQFAFGVTLYRAVYRKRPFRGDTLAALSESVCAGRLVTPPADRPVPEGLARLIERCLATAAEDRYADMDTALEVLERYLPSAERERRGRRRLIAAVATVAVVGLSAVGVARTVWPSQPSGIPAAGRCALTQAMLDARWTPELRGRLELRFADAGASKDWAKIGGRLDDYAAAWHEAQRSLCAGELPSELDPLADACLETRASELQAVTDVLLETTDDHLALVGHALTSELGKPQDCRDDRWLRAMPSPPKDAGVAASVQALRLELTRAKALLRAGRYNDAERIGKACETQALALGYDPLSAEAYLFLSALYVRLGKTQAARDTLVKTARFTEASDHDWVRLETRVLDAKLLGFDMVDSTELLESQIQGLTESLPGTDRLAAKADVYLALKEIAHGELEKARDKALAGLQVLRSEDADTTYATAVATLALTLLGRYAEAHEIINETLQTTDNRHPDAMFAFGIGGMLHMFEGDDERAVELFTRAQAIDDALGGQQTFQRGTALAYQATSLDRLGRFDDAIASYEDGITLILETHGKDHPLLARVNLQLGTTHLRAGNYEQAEAAFEESQRIWSGSHAPHSRALSQPLTGIARVRLEQGENEEALDLLEQALPKLEEVSGHPWEAALTKFYTAVALAKTRGDLDRARTLAREAAELLDGGDGQTVGPGFDPLREEIAAWRERHGE
ncbi:serine/threonine kinase family protein [Plesiocystis pacifica SIR-1]|uniref:Serine/threonine kinase family protein n=1 Tax=Plesiocystis pacifica SIR-1 TaxID=391625 RepID=A6FX06_9BACT|nr:serine/threonine-protein kinase [Plesiocystis pacifica]EDM81830.1 serine/threonine kinase family protein [Plesiocystis pacifica SIR-1]